MSQGADGIHQHWVYTSLRRSCAVASGQSSYFTTTRTELGERYTLRNRFKPYMQSYVTQQVFSLDLTHTVTTPPKPPVLRTHAPKPLQTYMPKPSRPHTCAAPTQSPTPRPLTRPPQHREQRPPPSPSTPLKPPPYIDRVPRPHTRRYSRKPSLRLHAASRRTPMTHAHIHIARAVVALQPRAQAPHHVLARRPPSPEYITVVRSSHVVLCGQCRGLIMLTCVA